MADAYGLLWPGDKEFMSVISKGTDVSEQVERYRLSKVPLVIETPKARHADELYQVLKDLTGLAKLAASALNTYQAALRNADLLLEQIERESMEDSSNDKPNG